jgi:HEPN domain-containing protein
MSREADDRLADAELLESHAESTSDSAYQLRLLAFELLLKATVRIHDGAPGRSHQYPELFQSLPNGVSSRLVDVARDRMTTSADYSHVDSVLRVLATNFVELRYPYEKYEGITAEAYIARGTQWIEGGASLERADFVYHPEELNGLVFALQAEVRSWLDP